MLRALAPAGMCLPSRCLAMGLYVTIRSIPVTTVILFDDDGDYKDNHPNVIPQ
jgi:hypothetical protein